ncbi:MAG: metallophosphatase family protein [Balneolales bacterium]|nr:metallophosphatase family protein [Balneolales bacterium]
MIKIGLLSDTHNYLDPAILTYFETCDEIWHAGDFGTIAIADELRKVAPVIGVYGNIDGTDIKYDFPLVVRREVEGVHFFMTHIGGHPGRYALPVLQELKEHTPDVFICGHSHILKIVRDKSKNNMLYLNPGAAGRHGFQQYRTIVRFEVHAGKLQNMEVINLSDEGR